MCNACGFRCCAMDAFNRCGCDDCAYSACWEVCEMCQLYASDCVCYEDDGDYMELDEQEG